MNRGKRRPYRRGHSGFRNVSSRNHSERMNSESQPIRTFSKGEEVSNRREYNAQTNYPNQDRFPISNNNNRMMNFAFAQDKNLPSNVTVSSDCPESEYMPYNSFEHQLNDARSEAISARRENLDDNPVEEGRESSMLDNIANFQKQLENTKPYELILEYRNRIDDMAKKSIKKNLKAIETLIEMKTEDNKQIFQTQEENFHLQRNEFESYITEVKQQLSSLSTLDVFKIIPKAENLIKEVKLECDIFNRILPGYSLKSKIISKLKDNQITIIKSDSIYYLDVILPIILSKQYADYKILCCEANKIQCCSLKKNISILYPNCEESSIEVFSPNEMLGFVTKYAFLNKSEKDFIVICKLPLRRSIILDLLLAYLKDILEDQSECRLILLLSTNDKSLKYEQYFSEFDVGLIKPPGLSFPVATIWKNEPLLPTDDYNDEVVKTVISIHVLKDNDGGDIMVFLPTLSDAKTALADLKIKLHELEISNIECFMLHEDSPNSNWIDMSFRKTSNKRTVFFVNDCAELFIIPSVRYIVDSGLKKEHIYDTTKKIDVLTTAFISCDKAKLRKKMAGYFLNGICYRLYNKENFCKEMPASECPEILSINPFNAMLKLFQYQPNNAINIELVESIPEDIKRRTLTLLKKSNAVKDNKLTALGQQMIKLNLPPLYAKLILVGIEWELSYETVILVAFFSVKGRLFKFFSDAKEQKQVDASKLQLLEAESDTISYIRIYKLWLENNENSSWCLQYNINEDTLKLVHAKVIELCKLIGENIKQNIPLVFNKTKEATNWLVELLFECFQRNLCVFTGHYKSGYRVLSSRCVSFIHPSSMISLTEEPPQFIIFDHIHSTKRDFLVHITSIPTDMIMIALTKQTLNFDYSDMFENTLREEIIEPVSEKIINQVFLGKKGHKLKEIEKQIRKILADESIVVEPSVEKRQISVFASSDHIVDAVKCVNDILKKELEIISNSENIQILELKKGSTTIPIEIGWVKGGRVKKLKALSQTNHGSTSDINQDTESNDVPYAIRQSINVTWTRRKCTGRALVKFSRALFSYARRFAMRSIPLLGVEVFITSDDRTSSLILSGLPHLATANEIKNGLLKIIQADINFERIELEYEPPMQTSENDLQEIKKLLESACHEHTELVDFIIIVPMPPKNTATVMKAFINVSKDENIKVAAENLSKSLNNFPGAIVRPVYSSIIKCSVKICKALGSCFREKLVELEAMVKDNFSEEVPFKFTVVKDNEELSSIKMLSNCLEILEALQRTIYSLLEGDILNKNFSKDIGKLFCRGGYLWLKTLEETDCCIIPNCKNKTIRLYGPKDKLHIIKQRILQFLLDSESEVVKNIPLYTDTNNKILLKTLLIEYGVHLENFIITCGLRSAELSIKTCTLSIHGNRDSIEKAENLLKDLASKIDFDSFSEILEDGEYCPVCACPALNLTYRLELCGHLYCCECMEGLVEQAQFPIQCCYEDCNEDVLLDDINKILADDPERINNLLEKSMKKFLEEHQNDYFYCPAPDCSMFFNKKEVFTEKHQCPLCLNEICIKCSVVYHQGYSCDMYQGSKNDPDYSFKVWQKNSTECKQCPKCKTAIQKSGGCDHMTCKSCQSHFCWICVQEFADARAVYEHIPFCARHPKW